MSGERVNWLACPMGQATLPGTMHGDRAWETVEFSA